MVRNVGGGRPGEGGIDRTVDVGRGDDAEPGQPLPVLGDRPVRSHAPRLAEWVPAVEHRIAQLAEPCAPGRHDLIDLGLGLGHSGAEERVTLICEADPERVESSLADLTHLTAIADRKLAAVGGKREIARTALTLLHEASENAPDIIASAKRERLRLRRSLDEADGIAAE